MILLSGVGRWHGARILFREVSLRVSAGRRIAVVGANGVGKTTLLEIIAGEQSPDAGDVSRAKDTAVGFLRQEVGERYLPAGGSGAGAGGRQALPDGERTALAEVLTGADHIGGLERRMRALESQMTHAADGEEQAGLLAEYGRLQDRFEHLGGYGLEAEARRVLAGLGFAEPDMGRELAALSGGWMMRVALARLLLAEPDVLLLDEPTNHLDLASVTWLQAFLANYAGAIVLVSHDRDFIDTVANRVVELAGGTATEYAGNYEAFVAQRTLRLEQLRAAARNQERLIAHTERFIERFRYKASKARQVQSRVKQLQRIQPVEVPDDGLGGRRMHLRFPDPPRAGREVVRLRGVGKRYGPRVVYDGLDLTVERGQKCALIGPNGAGKSTLLKILAGVLPVDAGTRELGHNVRVAYFAQHQIEALDDGNTVLQELSSAVDSATINPRSVLGAFLFSGDDVDKRVGVLSGGERSRLALAKLLANPVNLLCLDEPTNHLDIASRDVLEDALVDYPGAVVLITHDRYLIRSVANTIIEVGAGSATVHPGDYDYYSDRVAARAAATPSPRSSPPPAAAGAPLVPRPAGAADAGERRRAEAQRRNRVHRATRALRERLARVEADLMVAEADVAELTRILADPASYGDGEQVRGLVAAHNAAKDRAVALTAEWEQLVEDLDAATARAEQSA